MRKIKCKYSDDFLKKYTLKKLITLKQLVTFKNKFTLNKSINKFKTKHSILRSIKLLLDKKKNINKPHKFSLILNRCYKFAKFKYFKSLTHIHMVKCIYGLSYLDSFLYQKKLKKKLKKKVIITYKIKRINCINYKPNLKGWHVRYFIVDMVRGGLFNKLKYGKKLKFLYISLFLRKSRLCLIFNLIRRRRNAFLQLSSFNIFENIKRMIGVVSITPKYCSIVKKKIVFSNTLKLGRLKFYSTLNLKKSKKFIKKKKYHFLDLEGWLIKKFTLKNLL